MSEAPAYRVRAVRCSHRASDQEVYQALKRATDPLDRAWAKLEAASRITIKFNQAFEPDRLVRYEGQFQELVDPQVARALLRLLRERTRAELVCTEISVMVDDNPQLTSEQTMTLMPVLREFDVRWVDGDLPPHRLCDVPGGGLMFERYLLPECVVDTDAFISVQKIKNHRFMGVTLCLKNLFGLPPREPHGRARVYFHHLVRLPYVLVDLGRIIQPTLNILDGMVCQSGGEWGGEARIGDTLVAGDHVIATDACGAYLMGHRPQGDWPEPPYRRDRNSIAVAAEDGFGTDLLDRIDFESEVEAPIAQFDSHQSDPHPLVVSWLRTTSEQALHYRDHMREYVDRYAGEFILLQDGEVRWHDKHSDLGRSRRVLAGARKESGMWMKLVDPEETEGEHFEIYERTLQRLKEMGE